MARSSWVSDLGTLQNGSLAAGDHGPRTSFLLDGETQSVPWMEI